MKSNRKIFIVLAFALAVLILGSASILSFAEGDSDSALGITSIDLSLDDSITVRLNTTAENDDGSKLVVSFGGKETTLTDHKNGVFFFTGVTPQKLGDTLTATLYSVSGDQLGEPVSFSVQSYLESLISLSFEESGCETQIKYTAMRELAVNMLNYGAAAQAYTGTDVNNLVNKNLTDEQKALATKPIAVSETDTKVNGSAWVGAGVRFDYRLGMYFIFKASGLNGVSATVNGVKVTPATYDASRNLYIIRYSAFNVTEMNDVVTAKVVINGKTHTLDYSFKSYVAAKGNDDSALAKLVNAAYAYGYAAVAYSNDLELITAPTFESEGFVAVESNGYDFTGTPYASITLPKLSFEDYTTTTTRAGDVNPSVTTVFEYNDGSFDYSVVFNTSDCIAVNRGADTLIASKYDYEKLNTDIVTITYDEKTGYTYTVADGHTETGVTGVGVRTYGNMLTLVGNIEISCSSRWGHNFGLTVGAPDKAANVKLVTTASDYGVVLWDGADMIVNEGSSLTVTGSAPESIRTYAEGSHITIDGTVTVDNTVNLRYYTDWTHPYGDNYGLNPSLYVRKGTLTINNGTLKVNMLQVGSLKEGHYGILNIKCGGDAICAYNNTKGFRYAFSNGELNLTTTASGKTAIVLSCSSSAYIWFDAGMKVTLNTEGDGTYSNFIGEWKGNSYDYRIAIHSDAKFDIPESTSRFYNNSSKASFYGNFFTTATINIDGVEKTVCIANAHTNKNASFNVVPSDWLTAENEDGTKSVAAVVPVEGATYTTEEGSTYVGDWSFNKATYTDEAGVTHTIYYK